MGGSEEQPASKVVHNCLWSTSSALSFPLISCFWGKTGYRNILWSPPVRTCRFRPVAGVMIMSVFPPDSRPVVPGPGDAGIPAAFRAAVHECAPPSPEDMPLQNNVSWRGMHYCFTGSIPILRGSTAAVRNRPHPGHRRGTHISCRKCKAPPWAEPCPAP